MGKSTTCENLGIGLAMEGKKVLLVDTDPQGSLTISMGWQQPDELPTTLSTLMQKAMNDQPIPPGEGILHHAEGVDLIPANIELAGLEVALVNSMNREKMLKQVLEGAKREYDYILLDCMPSLGMLTINALAAADAALIPMQAQYLSAKGLEQLLQTVQKVRRQINPKLKIEGILLTMTDSRTNYGKQISSLIRQAYGKHLKVFEQTIPRSVRAAETSAAGKSIFAYPVARSESKENLERLLRQPGNIHLHNLTVNLTPAHEPDEDKPPLTDEELDELPISTVMDGKVQTFPDAAALDEALNAEPAPEPAGNFRITDDHLGEGGAKQKYARNIEAIRTLFKLEREHRGATPEEQQVLSQYVGWGGLADAFDPNKDGWAKEYTELKGLLSEDEYAAARSSTLNAHYTSPTVIRGIYDAVERMGFRSGNILEPSMGVGNFFGMLPDSMADSRLYGVELDSITGRIAKMLYPQADITVAGFETTDRRDFYDLAVGNVPFGQYKVNDKAYNKLGFSIKKIQKDLEAKQKELDDLKAETILVIRGVSALDKELLGTLVAEAREALETLEKQLVQAQEEYEEATKTAKRSNYICNELFTWADVYDTANHDERRAILQQFIKEIRVRKDYEISITLNASFSQVEQLKAVSTYDGADIFEEISEKGA